MQTTQPDTQLAIPLPLPNTENIFIDIERHLDNYVNCSKTGIEFIEKMQSHFARFFKQNKTKQHGNFKNFTYKVKKVEKVKKPYNIRKFLTKNNRYARLIARLYGMFCCDILDIHSDACQLTSEMTQLFTMQKLPLTFWKDYDVSPSTLYQNIADGLTTIFPICQEIHTRAMHQRNILHSMNYKVITMQSLTFIRHELQLLKPKLTVLHEKVNLIATMYYNIHYETPDDK